MRKALPALLLLSASACVAVPPAPVPPPANAGASGAADPRFDPANVRAEVERYVGERLGAEALALARSSPSSIMAVYHEGLPRPPVQQPDGSWRHPPPPTNAFVRTGAGWTGWSGERQQPLSAARAAEVERILADPAFWSEPAYQEPVCTDAGAQRLVVRHAGRTAVRQQSCSGGGLTRRLFELVLGGPG